MYRIESKDLQKLVKDCRALSDGKALRRDLAAGIRDELRPAAAAAKAAYLASPSRSGTGRLRARLARAVTVQVRLSGAQAGVSIRVAGSKMPSGQGALPKYREGAGKWRHPVFGHDVWVDQPAVPTFYEAIRPFVPRVQVAVRRIAVDLERRIAGKG